MSFWGTWMLAVAVGNTASEPPSWEETIEAVTPAIVSLTVTTVRDFDTEQAGTVVGTGFIVDAEQGLLLTNRHLVQPGPVLAEAAFADDEVVPLVAVYRDPVHDFGLFRFDPSKVRHTQLKALELAPDAARVGAEVRVIGSDGGEKLSILGGTLARLDRDAPNYGRGSYNDFNTYYLQAATNTSGGSSGAPVIDQSGRVLALNAGGSMQAASSYYLPLHRVQRVLHALRAGNEIPRGGLQTTFRHAPYSELRRRGISADTEAQLRTVSPTSNGLLTVQDVLPGGVADTRLQAGDALVALSGVPIRSFQDLDELLDNSVGTQLTATFLRLDEELEVALDVADLKAITPHAYMEVGGAILHDLSYQQARAHGVPQRGVFVADPGYMFSAGGIVDRAVIIEVDGIATPTLSALMDVLERAGNGRRLTVRFHLVGDPSHAYERAIVMDRTWFPTRFCREQDGLWPCQDLPAPAPDSPEKVPGDLVLSPVNSKLAARVGPSLVIVDERVPYPTAGHTGRASSGVGAIIDAERGLVVTSREAVPVALGDVTLTFAGVLRVPGRPVALHPVHNLAVIAYDPADLGPLVPTELTWSNGPLQEDERLHLVGLDASGKIVDRPVQLDQVEWLNNPIEHMPRFRDQNIEVGRISGAPESLGGVLVDRRGRTRALWVSFGWNGRKRRMAALPTPFVWPLIEPMRAGETPAIFALGAELRPLPLADARERGMPDAIIAEIQRADPRHATAVEVIRVASQTPAAEVLRDGDLLVSIAGQPILMPSQLEALLRDGEPLALQVIRRGEVMSLSVQPDASDTTGIRRVVTWAGAVVHAPHRALFAQRHTSADGVYVAWRWDGSPAAGSGLRPGERIVQIDDHPTPDLDHFIEVVGELDAGRHVVLRIEELDGRQRVRHLFLDRDHWPGLLLDGTSDNWTRVTIAP